MAWSGINTLLNNQNVVAGGSAQQTALVTLLPGEQAHVQLDIDWPSSSTDDLIVRVKSSLSTNEDTIPIWSQTVSTSGTNPDFISFLVSGVYKFLVELEVDGSSDTIQVTVQYRTDGVSM